MNKIAKISIGSVVGVGVVSTITVLGMKVMGSSKEKPAKQTFLAQGEQPNGFPDGTGQTVANTQGNFINVFPEIFSNTLYPYIDFEKSESHISDQMISKLIKRVVTDMNITDGSVSWWYIRIDSKHVNVRFVWYGARGNQSRTYKIKLN